MSKPEPKPFGVSDLCDIGTERALLRALVEEIGEECPLALVKLRESHFYDVGNQGIFGVVKDLESRGFAMSMETVLAEVGSSKPDLMAALLQVAGAEPASALMFSVETLAEWERKRTLLTGAQRMIQGLAAGEPAFKCANEAQQTVDDVSAVSVDDFTSYRVLKERAEKEPPTPKIPTKLPLLDVKLRGGIEFGQFIGLMGDPEAGKTALGTQILRSITAQGHETLFFNFEFHYKQFLAANKMNENKFNLDKFLMESDNNDILDIEAKIKLFARRGGRMVLIDSQMMITNIRNTGTSSERETEKFFILQRLVIRYGMIIILIAQQGKEDTRSGTITPMGSKNAAHALHQIWYIKKQKLGFDEEGDDERKGERDLVCYKNKQTGVHFSKPMYLHPKTLEFRGVQKHGSEAGSWGDAEPTVYEYEDKNGNVEPLGAFDSLGEVPPI